MSRASVACSVASKLLQLLEGLRRPGRALRKLGGIEHQTRRWWSLTRVRVREPIADVEEFAHGSQCVCFLDWLDTVYGLIAQPRNQPRFAEHRLSCLGLQPWLVDQSTQIVLVWELERSVGRVRPYDRQLESPACIKASSTWVLVNGRLGLKGRFMYRRPFDLKEVEVAQGSRDRLNSVP